MSNKRFFRNIFSTLSAHYPSITEYRFGRPASDGNHLYETRVTKSNLIPLSGQEINLYRELFSFPIKDNPFFVKVNSIPGRGFIPNYLVWGFCVWGWDFKRVKARCSVLGFKVELLECYVILKHNTDYRTLNLLNTQH